jgi:hypothetical protein
MVIKAISKGPWGAREPQYHTWYEPYDGQQDIERMVQFALSQQITGVISAGDARLLPAILEAGERFVAMSSDQQAELVEAATGREPLFP